MLCGLIQPRHPEKEINFPRATLVGYSNAIYLQQQHPSIKHTPLHAVKTSGHPSGRAPNSTSTDQVTISTISRVESYLKKASLVEVTVNVDIFMKVPLFSRASLAETTVATATRRTTTVPTTSSREAPILLKASLVVSTIARTKEWRRKSFLHWQGPGLQLKATPKGPARTSQREPGSRSRRTPYKFR